LTCLQRVKPNVHPWKNSECLNPFKFGSQLNKWNYVRNS
jgi:hypothetical protein